MPAAVLFMQADVLSAVRCKKAIRAVGKNDDCENRNYNTKRR